MVTYPPPKSNVQRQREFQDRNPGYDARRKAKQRAAAKAEFERMRLTQQTTVTEAVSQPLMLQAPVEPIVVPWTVEEIRQREAMLTALPNENRGESLLRSTQNPDRKMLREEVQTNSAKH